MSSLPLDHTKALDESLTNRRRKRDEEDGKKEEEDGHASKKQRLDKKELKEEEEDLYEDGITCEISVLQCPIDVCQIRSMTDYANKMVAHLDQNESDQYVRIDIEMNEPLAQAASFCNISPDESTQRSYACVPIKQWSKFDQYLKVYVRLNSQLEKGGTLCVQFTRDKLPSEMSDKELQIVGGTPRWLVVYSMVIEFPPLVIKSSNDCAICMESCQSSKDASLLKKQELKNKVMLSQMSDTLKADTCKFVDEQPDLSNNSNVVVTTCGHSFHNPCMKQYLLSQNKMTNETPSRCLFKGCGHGSILEHDTTFSCPMCRMNVSF